jgi:hypothetical protein
MGNRAKRSPKTRSRPVVEMLEPRILLSADIPGVDALLASHDPDDIVDTDAVLERAEAAFALLADQLAEHQAGAGAGAGARDAPASPTELIIVDGGIEDHATLIDDLLAGENGDRRFEVVILDSQRDGIEQMAQLLSNHSDLAAIHLLSHGADGQFQVGDVTVDQAMLDSRASDIAAWGQALAADGDLLIYGCNLAATEVGEALVGALADLTGADVAASDDLTGHPDSGADWDLEYRLGLIETTTLSDPSPSGWDATLALTPSGGETLVNTSTLGTQQLTPFGGGNVAMDHAGNSVVVWNDLNGGDIYFQRYNISGAAVGTQTQANTETTYPLSEAQVAMDADGDFVVVWMSGGQDGSGDGIYAQRFDDSGATLGIEFRVNTTTTNDQGLPAVAMDDAGNFVVTWTDRVADGDSFGIFAQRFDAAGGLQGTEFQVNTTSTGSQMYPVIAMNGSGAFVIAWEGDPGGDEIYFQRFDSNGTAQGGETRANTTILNSQWNAAIGMDDSGNFVIVWEDTSGADGNTSGILGQRFDASGVAQGSEFVVNSTVAGTQTVPAVAMAGDGSFTVSWQSANQDGSGLGVYLQQFDAAGNTVDSETRVNTTTMSDQMLPSVAVNGSNVIVAWSGNGTGDAAGVFKQSYVTGSQTFTVTNTNDSGAGSLRQAILDANANAGQHDTIDFAIGTGAGGYVDPTPLEPGSGDEYWTINLSSALPEITDAVNIDATTQTNWLAGSFMPIVLDGNNGAYAGLTLSPDADGSTIRGLVIRDFDGSGISTQASNVTIAGNWIGYFNADGTSADIDEANTRVQINMVGDNNVIGGTTLADRNVLAGGTFGIWLAGENTHSNVIAGNYIGTDVTGTFDHGNSQYGIRVSASANNNIIGGATDSHRNIIAGSDAIGIDISGEAADGNVIRNNWIGLGADGTTVLGNATRGILISSGADDTTIGGVDMGNVIVGSGEHGIEISNDTTGTIVQGNFIGTDETLELSGVQQQNGIRINTASLASNNTFGGIAPGEGNVITNSGLTAVALAGNGTGNLVVGNSIYNNAGIGIDIGSTGITLNDVLDIDTGSNNLQNFPVITKAHSNGTQITLSGSLHTNATTSDIYIDFYATTTDDTADREGERYLGRTGPLTTDDSGDVIFTDVVLTAYVGADDLVTATTTVHNNTSEFSQAFSPSTTLPPDDLAPTDLSSGIRLNTDGGNDSYLFTNDGGVIFGSQPALTLEATFRIDAPNSLNTILSYAGNAGSNEVALQVTDAGHIRFYIDNILTTSAQSYDQLLDGKMHYVAVTWDASSGSAHLYVDGAYAEAFSGLATGAALVDSGTIVLGQEQDSIGGSFETNETFFGTLYDVRIWNEVRSAAEIALNYQHKFAPGHLPTGLVANWQMDGFNGINQIVDVVDGRNLSIGHATDTGFSPSTPATDLHVRENAVGGTLVGYVVPSDPDVSNDIVNDGLFTEASDPSTYYTFESGQSIGELDSRRTRCCSLA